MPRTTQTTPRQGANGRPDRNQLVAQLREVLGVDQRRAQRLLDDTDGDFDAAVGLHFAQGDAEAGPSTGRPSSREGELRLALNGMGLPSLTPTQAKRLLAKSSNSVDAAVELLLSDPNAAGAPSAAEKRTEEVVLLDSTSQEDAGEAEGDDGSDSEDSEGSKNEEEEEASDEEAAAPAAAGQEEPERARLVAGYMQMDDSDMLDSLDDSFGNASSGFGSGSDDDDQGPLAQGALCYDVFFNMNAIQHPDAATAGMLPSLDDAAYQNARKGPIHGADDLPLPLPLPLPELRDRNGRLAATDPSVVPRRVEPDPEADIDPSEPLFLGSIDLPLHAVNRTVLARLAVAQGDGPLEWTPTSDLAYSYVMPSIERITRSYAEDFSGFVSRPSIISAVMRGEVPVQLSLGGPTLSDASYFPSSTTDEEKLAAGPAAIVREKASWVNQTVASLGILNITGAVQLQFTLFKHGDDAQPWQLEGAGGAITDAQRRTLTNKSASAAQKKKAEEAVTKAAAKLAEEDWEGPTLARVGVWLTPAALEQLSDTADGEARLNMRGVNGNESKKLKFWSRCSTALSNILSALLTHGRGLRTGPDCDGLLNYCDSDSAELAAADSAAPAQIRKAFNVKNLLDSVALPPSKQLGPNAATVRLPRPPGLLSTPKRYQLAGLQWMLDRERKGDALGRGHAKLHPAWLQLVTPRAADDAGDAPPRLLYVHRMRTHALSANFYTAPPVGTCGGCICDEMGLGKTLQTLMLVAENPPPAGWAEKKIDPSRTVSHNNPIPIKTTLLVAPTTLLGQWEDEIKKHLAPRKLKWGRYVNPLDGAAMRALREAGGVADDEDSEAAEWEAEAVAARGAGRGRPVRARKATTMYSPSRESSAAPQGGKGKKGRPKGGAAAAAPAAQPATTRRPGNAFSPVLCALPSGAPAHIETLDLCLCSYEDLRDQLASGAGHRLSALQQFGFWRVCLDEAQMVANTNSVAATMASSLWRRHAWCVTGTPVTSNLSEIRGLLEFLALEPVFETDTWGRLVQHGVSDASPRGLGVLRALLRGVMLRRSKVDVADELDLPPCTREDLPVVLSTVERTSYERLKREFLEAVRQLRRHQDAAVNAHRSSDAARAASRAAARAVSALTALRQSTAHPQLAHGGAAVGPTTQRLSMAEIIDRLVAQAYGEYDIAVRALAERRLLEAAAKVAFSGGSDGEAPDPIDAAFSPLIAFLDRAATVAGLFLLERNACPGLRDAEGEVRGGAEAMAAVTAKAAVDAEEAAAEDAELWQAREAHTAQLLQIAREWDKAHPELAKPKPKKGKKAAAGGKKTGGGAGGSAGAGGGKRKRGAASEPKGRSKKKARGRRAPGSEEEYEDSEEEEEWDSDDALDEEAEAAAADGAGSDGEDYRPAAPAAEGDDVDLMELEEHHAAGEGAGGSGEAAKKRKGPSMKGRKFARRQVGARPELEPRRHALRREAAARRRAWERLKLSALELVLHLRKEEAGLVVGKWSSAAKRAASARRKEGALEGLWEAAEEAVQAQRERLGLDPSAAAAAAAGGIDALRRSRRQAGIDAASTLDVVLDPEEIREQLENAVVIVRTYKDSCGSRDPPTLAAGHTATAASEASATYHRLQFVVDQHATAAREAAHAAAATGAGPSSAAGAGPSSGVQQEDPNTCPICLDTLEESTLAITRCSHKFCGPCIRETLARETPAPCPICRTPLRDEDLYEAMSAEEAAIAARAAAATNQMTGEYGAKVAAVLDIVATLTETEGPDAKVVVFSSWGRALRLVGDALDANGVHYAALAGAAAAKRASLLHDFLNNPSCRVLLVLMSNSGGAAGLTLTAATTAILLEPCVNPGLEAQAAARIHRLGQTRPTRVVRLLAEDTVDAAVVEQQKWKVAAGDVETVAADEVDHGTVSAIADLLTKNTGASPAAAAAAGDGAGPSNTRH